MATAPKGKNARCSNRTLYDNNGVPIHRSSLPTVDIEGVQHRLVWWKQADASKGEVHPCQLPDGTHVITGAGHEYRIKVRDGELLEDRLMPKSVARILDEVGIKSLSSLEQALSAGPVEWLSPERQDVLRERLAHRAKLKSGIKVIVGGPPHSGKSVFIEGLKQVLPDGDTFLFSACPDGEGAWLQKYYDDPDVVRLRQKGQFTEDFVKRSRDVVKTWVGPLMLVDIGGRTSEENAEIIQGATHAIILSGDPSATAEWQSFFASRGLGVVATLHSDYTGSRDVFEIDGDHVNGSVHYLERGEKASDRETVLAVADVLTHMVRDNIDLVTPIENHELTVQVRDILDTLPGREVVRTLPSGSTVVNRVLERSSLPMLYQRIAENSSSGSVLLDGPVNGWEAIALVSAYQESGCSDVSVRGPDGFVPVTPLPQTAKGDAVSWDVRTDVINGETVYVVHADVSASTNLLDPSVLPDMTIPAVPDGSTVVISTQGPHWFRTSVALGYQQNCDAVASFTPGEGATVAWSKDAERLGQQLWVAI